MGGAGRRRAVGPEARADALLLLTAAIWGCSFVALRSGMRSMGPFAYSGVRFALGTVSLLPLLAWIRRRRDGAPPEPGAPPRHGPLGRILWPALVGVILFGAANLQQVGLVTTTAGNAGFITSLFVILVPVVRFLHGWPVGRSVWAGAALALAGLYFLSVGPGFAMARGDLLCLAAALFWTGQILLINRLVARQEEIAVGQFATCAVLSLLAALAWEPAPWAGIRAAALPILYGGLLSIGGGYTLQIVAQKHARPTHASIIMAMQALFAGLGGVLLLHEPWSLRLAAGGLLMLAGMVVSQLAPEGPEPHRAPAGPRVDKPASEFDN
jgi:drug/metabolite transporter (DMT)-like permease